MIESSYSEKGQILESAIQHLIIHFCFCEELTIVVRKQSVCNPEFKNHGKHEAPQYLRSALIHGNTGGFTHICRRCVRRGKRGEIASEDFWVELMCSPPSVSLTCCTSNLSRPSAVKKKNRRQKLDICGSSLRKSSYCGNK